MGKYVSVPVVPQRQAVDVEPILASVEEAGVCLKLSKPQIYKMARNGEMPFKRFGAAIRIPWWWLREQDKVGDCPTGVSESNQGGLE